MKRVNLLAAGMLVLGQFISGGVSAASVTLTGNTVDFTFDDSLLGLFGNPVVSGNTLVFTPVGFDAQAFNGNAFDLANQTMNIRLAAHQGFSIGKVGLQERGDYLLLGPASAVDVAGQIRVFDLANPATDFTSSIAATAPTTTVGLPTHDWIATAGVDVSARNMANANVTVQNLLIARAFGAESLAFVEKKYAGLTVGTMPVTPVPEAETWAMMLAGLGLVGWSARRHRKHLV